jgi:hypothetical protein
LQKTNYDPLIGQKRLDIAFPVVNKLFGETVFGLNECVVHQRLRVVSARKTLTFTGEKPNEMQS